MSANIAYYGGIVTDGLVLNMDSTKRASYPGFGNTWTSVARGSSVVGSLVNSPSYNASSSSLAFDAVDEYCQLPALGLNYPFNMSMIATVPTSSVVNGMAVTFSDPAANNKSVGISLLPESTVAQIRAWYYSSSTGFQAAVQSNPLFNTVYNISANYTTSNIVLYVNGALINTLNLAQTKQWTETSTSYNIARLNRVGTIYYGGLIFQTLVYNRTLSAAEILRNYNAQRGRFGL